MRLRKGDEHPDKVVQEKWMHLFSLTKFSLEAFNDFKNWEVNYRKLNTYNINN